MFYLVYAVFVSWIRKIIIISFAILLISSCLISKIMVRIKISSIYIYRIHRVKRNKPCRPRGSDILHSPRVHRFGLSSAPVMVYSRYHVFTVTSLTWTYASTTFSWKAIFQRHVVAFWNQCIKFILFAKICISRKSRRDSAGIFKKPD